MHINSGSRLRCCTYMQQLLLGIVQGRLILALPTTNNNHDRWIAGLISMLNSVLSIILLTRCRAQLHPEKRTHALRLIGIGFVGNFSALCALLVWNRHEELSRILTFRSRGTPFNALAVLFYVTVYITLILSIAFASYSIIDVPDIQQTGEQPDKAERHKNIPDEVPEISIPDPRRRRSILTEPSLDTSSKNNSRMEDWKNQRRASRNPTAPRDITTHWFDAEHDAPESGRDGALCPDRRPRSSMTRGKLVEAVSTANRPPTPPPPPALAPLIWAAGTKQRADSLINLRRDLEEATRTFPKAQREYS